VARGLKKLPTPALPAYLTGGNVTSALRHEPDTTLGIWALERIDVVDEWWLGRDLEVSNHRVTLQKKHVKKIMVQIRKHWILNTEEND
jgi:hypothetical protein